MSAFGRVLPIVLDGCSAAAAVGSCRPNIVIQRTADLGRFAGSAFDFSHAQRDGSLQA